MPRWPARAVSVPGQPAAVAEAPAADPAVDDLAAYETETLPPAPPPVIPQAEGVTFSPEQQAAIAKMIGDAVTAAKSSQDPRAAAKLAAGLGDKLPTQEQAAIMCEDAVARGVRPRAVLTVDGWYVHPEMARRPDMGAIGAIEG